MLLNKPKLIILDEPSNGLDPKGVMELRETILNLVEKENVSILFSSHILGEIEKIATRIVCIRNGEIIPMQNDLYKNRAVSAKDENNNHKAKQIISEAGAVVQEKEMNVLSILLSKEQPLKQVIKKLVEADVEIEDIEKEVVSIESIYSSIYGG